IWRLERKTESLAFSPRAIRARALRARRSLLRFFSLISRSSKILRTRSLQSGLLGFLHHDALVRVAHTLALVGLRRTIPANLGRDLTNLLLVGTANDDLGLGRRLDGHTVGHAEIDRVTEPELQIKLAALGLRTITNADKVQFLLETVGNALHHVVDECTHRTCHGGCSARRGLEGQHTFFEAAPGGTTAMAGTMRALINNMVQGVTDGFEKKLNLIGVGYRAQAQGSKLNLQLGFSHPVEFSVPDGVTVETPTQTEIVISGADKQKVGQVAAEIRGYRPPEPYKGKGVRYSDERVVMKEAKKA